MAENPVTQEEQEEEEKKSSGNTGLPFGLCKKYGIALPDNATPRMAWEALKNKKGITPNDAYRQLKKEENEKRAKAERIYNDDNGENFVGVRKVKSSTSHMSEKGKRAFDSFQARTSGRKLKHEEALILSSDGTAVIAKRGAAHSVGFTLDETRRMKGCDIIHNHPSHNSVLSPSDAESKHSQIKSCTMCDLDGKRMTMVYADEITLEQRASFTRAYSDAFEKINKEAVSEFNKSGAQGKATLYPGITRKTKYYQDYALFQDIVKRKIKSWTDDNARRYNVEVFYDE